MDPLKRSNYISYIRSTLISGAITSVFMYLVYYPGWQSIGAGMFIGGLIYVAMNMYGHLFADRYLKKTNLLLVLIINTLANLFIMVIIAWAGVGIFYMKGNFRVMVENINNLLGYYYMVGLLFGFTLSVAFNFLSIVNTLVGRKVARG